MQGAYNWISESKELLIQRSNKIIYPPKAGFVRIWCCTKTLLLIYPSRRAQVPYITCSIHRPNGASKMIKKSVSMINRELIAKLETLTAISGLYSTGLFYFIWPVCKLMDKLCNLCISAQKVLLDQLLFPNDTTLNKTNFEHLCEQV